MADHESRSGESEGSEEDERARERKEGAKLRGKELGKARALQRREEREHMEQRRERKLDEERERQKERERKQERWRSLGRGRERKGESIGEASETGKQRRHSLLSSVEDPAPQRAGGGTGDARKGDAFRREDLTNTRAVSHRKDVDHEGRRGLKRRRRRSRDGRDDLVDAFSSGGEDACPDRMTAGAGRAREGDANRSRGRKSSLTTIERGIEQRSWRKREGSRVGSSSREAERTGLSRALERSDGVGGIDWGRWRMSPSPRASDPRAWHAYPPPSPPSPPSLRQSRFPRPRPGNTLSIGPSSRHPGTGASWHHLWFQEVLRPQVQGTGTLSSSPVQGMGSGTLAVAATGGRRILPSRGVGTLAVW